MKGHSRIEAALLVLGTADWNQSIATNQHHVSAGLAPEFETSTFVESIGLRRPQISTRDARRILVRLSGDRGENTSRREIPDGMSVVSPLVVPVHNRATQSLNTRLLQRATSRWREGEQPRLLWTYSPVTYGLENHADAVVYHCVDLLSEFPRMPRAALERGERHLADCGGLAIASSARVRDHLIERGFTSVRLWENVADVEAFSAPARPSNHPGGRIRAVFAGNLSTAKVDFPLLNKVVSSGVDLHLAGPIAEGGGASRAEVERLVDLGATYHGMLQVSELAGLFTTASVGLIPYLLNSYTLGVSPLKTFEYLAAGLSVVSTGLPGVEARGADVRIGSDHDDFIGSVTSIDWPSRTDVHRRLSIATQHSWKDRLIEARALARQSLEGIDAGSHT